MALTSDQQEQINRLADVGVAGRKIAEQLGISYKAVRIQLEKRSGVVATSTVRNVLTQPRVKQAVERNVFNITEGLQDCLNDIQDLVDLEPADPLKGFPLKDMVLAVKTKADIYMHAAGVIEKTYNARAVETVLQALFAEYEQESPDIQQRILKRIGNNPALAGLLQLLSDSGEDRPGS